MQQELGVASEKMQLMMQEIMRQHEQLTTAQKQIEADGSVTKAYLKQ